MLSRLRPLVQTSKLFAKSNFQSMQYGTKTPQPGLTKQQLTQSLLKHGINHEPDVRDVSASFHPDHPVHEGTSHAGDVIKLWHNSKGTSPGNKAGRFSTKDDLTGHTQAERIDKLAMLDWQKHPKTDVDSYSPHVQTADLPHLSGVVGPQPAVEGAKPRPDGLPTRGGATQLFHPFTRPDKFPLPKDHPYAHVKDQRYPMINDSEDARMLALHNAFPYGGTSPKYPKS